jgi:putative Ca2+/H+ antiporter (TMEM165/GDT1 family)
VTSEEEGLPGEEAAAAAVEQEAPLLPSSEPSVDAIGAVVAQPQKVEVAEEDVDTLFTKADIDANEQLSRTEFKTWWLDKEAHKQDFIDFHDKRDPNGVMIPRSFRDSVSMSEQRTVSFWTAFVNSVAMIIVTELGDKTFFIAAVLAMRHPTCIIFAGAISALAIMTVLSAAIGFALPSVLPRQYTHYAATALFVYFGLKLVKEGCEMVAKGEGTGPSDELEEVELELKDKHEDDAEAAGPSRCSGGKKGASHGAIFWQALTLTFLADGATAPRLPRSPSPPRASPSV